MQAKENGDMEVYKCATCGRTSTERGHLCSPRPARTVMVCDYCGTKQDPRHICRPKLAKLQYQCETCGRVAVNDFELCKPKKIK